MNFLSSLFSSGIGEVASGIGSLARDIRTAITGKLDPEKEAEIFSQLQQLEHQGKMAQVEVNKIEASHRNVFVSGWRPAIGWVCALGLLNHFILIPILTNIIGVVSLFLPEYSELSQYAVVGVDSDTLMELVVAMLGLGALRTYEKQKGINHR